MQISYLLYDGSAYPKLTPPVSSPYQTTLSFSLFLFLYLSPSSPLLLHSTLCHCLSLSLLFFFLLHFSIPFLPPNALFFTAPCLAVSVPRASVILTSPLLSSPSTFRLHTHTHARDESRLYSLLDSRARSSAFAFLAHAFPTSSRSCTHGVSHLWRMLLSLFMTRTVLILGLASKGLFKGRRTGVGCLSLSLSLLCDALSRNRLKTGGSNLHHPGGGGWLLSSSWWYSSTPLLPLRKDNCE